MKVRKQGTFESAVSEQIKVLGVEECARVVGKSTSLVRKWSDPDNTAIPSLEQALMLDIAYARSARSTPPVLHTFTSIIDKEFESEEDGEHILSAFFSLQRAVCDIGSNIADDFLAPDKVTQSHQQVWQTMLTKIDKILLEANDLERAINKWHKEHVGYAPEKTDEDGNNVVHGKF